ncbi:BglG family transcription antiterminator [Amphibacillus sediminis]|uniref:BglG family transcription antiterminator n=1 Tax=Amphibacillus sediminis TaxID=360185 RepID=UPI00082D207B|nr:BglG family transcription antiterminator [Amphibacillus sediminis]
MLSQKEVSILKLLYEKRHTYTSSQEISTALCVSDRTARKYLRHVRDAVENHHSYIEAKPGLGYRLIVNEGSTFEQFFQTEVNGTAPTGNIGTIHESKDRQYYILHRLFFEQHHTFVDDIATELYVSRSTISNDLIEIKKLLHPYQIQLKSKPSTGIYLEGSEQSFRHFIMNYFFMNRLVDNLYTFSTYSNLLGDISIEELVIIVLDECRETDLKISDFIIYNIVLHIGLAIRRIQLGFEIELENKLEFPEDSVEYQTALRIINRIKASMDIHFPVEEATYIALHLRNKTTTRLVFQRIPYDKNQIKQQLLEVLKAFDKETGYAIAQDKILVNGLMIHFTPLLLRLQNNTSIENPLLTEIKEKRSQLLALTIKHFAKMPVFQPYDVTESEWAYLTIHLAAAVERYYNGQKARVLVICATGLGSSQMLKTRLEHELGSKILIERVISYYEISEQSLEEIDLIISSINLPNVIHNIPIVHVSVFLDDHDIKTIEHELSRCRGIKQLFDIESDLNLDKQAKQTALINQCFRPELFLKVDHVADKATVLSELIGAIEHVEGYPIKQALAKQLKLRETYSSVAFSPYLAVPHPIEAVTNSAYAAVAIAPKGIFWDDKHPHVQLVFLLSPDLLNLTELEQISMMLVPIIENDMIRQSLVASTSFEQFIERFTKYLS